MAATMSTGLRATYGEALTIGLTVQDVQDWPDVLQAVTAEDVMAAAPTVLDRNHAVTGWLMKPRRTRNERMLRLHRRCCCWPSPCPRGPRSPSRRSPRPAASRPGWSRITASPSPRWRSAFEGGTSLDLPGKRGAVNLMTALLEEGAGDLDAQGFAAARDDLAARVRLFGGQRSASASRRSS